MELLHFAHRDCATGYHERIQQERAIYDPNQSLADYGGRVCGLTVREDHNDYNTAHQQDNHQDLKALDALLENEEGEDEGH